MLLSDFKEALNSRSLTQAEQWDLVAKYGTACQIMGNDQVRIKQLEAEAQRLRDALCEAPMRALGQTNGAFARWCIEQAQPPAPAEVQS